MSEVCVKIDGSIGHAAAADMFYAKVEITAPSGYKHIHTSDGFKLQEDAEAWLDEACEAVASAMKGRAALSGVKNIRSTVTLDTKRKSKYHG